MNIPTSTIKEWAPGPDIRFKRMWAIADPLLGTEPDVVVARKSGLSPDSISKRRQKKDIPAYVKPLKARTLHELEYLRQRRAERQVAQELLNAWKAP